MCGVTKLPQGWRYDWLTKLNPNEIRIVAKEPTSVLTDGISLVNVYPAITFKEGEFLDWLETTEG